MKFEKKESFSLNEPPLIIGVLALQGDFEKHCEMLRLLKVIPYLVRKPDDLDFCDGLIIPGGESTSMLRQIDFINLRVKLETFAKEKPLFGTCAGLILMSNEIIGYPMRSFGFLGVSVERNAFGRQLESFEANVEICLEKQKPKSIPAVFIRAPRIKKCHANLKILGTWQEEPIFVQEGYHLGATFHPELTSSTSVHEYFLNLVLKAKREASQKKLAGS